MYKLYKIVNKVNNHSYIGMTKQTINKRFCQHKDNAKNKFTKTKLYSAMRSYGCDAFEIFLLASFKTKEECCEAEIKYITEEGYYNLAKGGNGGFVILDIAEWKGKLSKARQGRKPALGMNHTQENKELFSKVSKEYWNNQETYNWEDIKHLSHKEAKIQFGISTTHYYRLKGRFGSNETK